jgi:protein tyrosine phosphatase (PTP) superfamily phosphohydrolase (DUF442 family)
MPVRFNKVSDGVYRGGEPSANDLRILSDIFGIQTIISLDGNIGGKISPLVKDLGMEHIVIPIGGRNTISLMNYLRDNVASLLRRKQPVYVHCRHGSDRTGMAIAHHRVNNQGWDRQKALSEAKAYGFGNKLDADTEELYTSMVLGKSLNEDSNDSLDDSIVGATRDFFDYGRVAPAFLTQQSFSAKDDIPMEGGDTSPMGGSDLSDQMPPDFKEPAAFSNSIDRSPTDQEERKRILRKMLLEEMSSNPIPQIGQYDNYSGIRGVGPVEPQYFLNL